MLSRLSVKKPMTVFVCVMLVLILGVMSFINMTTDLLPNMDLPYAIAYTTYIGASPEQVEQSVTKTLESALATTSGVKNITSISQENVSIVVLEFEEGTGMDSAMIEMNASLDQIAGSLPEAAGSPVLMKINPDIPSWYWRWIAIIWPETSFRNSPPPPSSRHWSGWTAWRPFPAAVWWKARSVWSWIKPKSMS